MHNLAKKLMLNRAVWTLIGGLVLAGLLGACSQVNVAVDNCQSGIAKGQPLRPLDGAGGCKPTPPLTAPTDAYGALNTANNNQPISDRDHKCNIGQYMCQSSPGTCVSGGVFKPCKTFFYPDAGNPLTGSCNCMCP